MPKYVSLFKWTDHGIKEAGAAIDRYDRVMEVAAESGVTFDSVVWTLGEYDIVATIDAPDDETITGLLLKLGATGTSRTKTMRAFTVDEMKAIVHKVP